ncbi:MAG: cytochrome c [Deltaproteobacteria bacterium]|nr:cytochrome c [Deltaproteobacteria bacterium]
MILSIAVVSGCSNQKQPAENTGAKAPAAAVTKTQGDLAVGKEIYFRYCHFCHGQKGEGDGPVGIALSPHPADFVNDSKRMSKTDEELYKSITEGIHKDIGGEAMSMPRWQDILSDKERRDVLYFIRHLEQEGKKAQGQNK